MSDNEKEGMSNLSRGTSMTSINSYSNAPAVTNGNMFPMKTLNGSQLIQRRPYSAGGPPVGVTTITQPPVAHVTSEPEPYYAAPDRRFKTSNETKSVIPPPQYTKVDDKNKKAPLPIDDPEADVNSYTLGGSPPSSARSGSVDGSPGQNMVTDIDDYASGVTPTVAKAQINSSDSKSGSSKGVANQGFDEDESKL